MNIFDDSLMLPYISTAGIGLTNKCNLNCAHCYSRKMGKKSIDINQAKKILKTFPNLKSANFGTGESILNQDFNKIVNLFHSKNIKLAITSNGLSVVAMKENMLKKFEDVDISLDFPNAEMHDQWRYKKGLYNEAIRAIERCKKYNINISITTVLMSNNYHLFADFKKLLDKYDIHLRINVYKSVNNSAFAPTYEQFWQAIKTMSEQFKLVSCSEPVLALVCEEKMNGSPCGNSARIHPDGTVSSCVYVKDNRSIERFNCDKKKLPEFCESCNIIEKCLGGCYGRRASENRKSLPDLYCPRYNNKEIPGFKFTKDKNSKELIHSSYLCTIILK